MTPAPPVSIRLDADGIPVSDYAPIDGMTVGSGRSIVAIAEMGLHYWNLAHPQHSPILTSYSWTSGQDSRVATPSERPVDASEGLLACANWLLEHVEPLDDSIVWVYDYPSYCRTQPGWRSGHGQGQAIRLLLRAHEQTGEPAYRDAAVAAVRAFGVPIEHGGFTRRLSGRRWWFSKFADRSSTEAFILNGMLFALLGLDDASRSLDSAHATYAFAQGARAVGRWLPRYGRGTWSTYDLAGKPSSAHYHAVHVSQLALLADASRLFRGRRVTRVRRTWGEANTSAAMGGVEERRQGSVRG